MRPIVVAALALAVVVALPAPAGAVLSGRNGRIAFTSGRAAGDNQAQIYLRSVTSSSGAGTLSDPIVPLGGQWRHASWSPDRTRLVIANGTPGSPTTERYDLFIKDFEANTLTQFISNTNTADHPAWSPDGTRIAYEEAPSNGSADRDIKVKTVGSIAQPALSLTSGAPKEFKPAWSPDSQFIYYAKDNPTPQFLDIVKRPSTGGPEVPVQAASGIDEYQPSISPDGTKMCFTLQTTPGNSNTSNIYVTDLVNPGALLKISQDNATGNINCTWSPDGTMIAYVRGTFSAGELVMARSDGTSLSPISLAQDPGADNFDGNPDWAPDGPPVCPDSTVTTTVGKPVAIPLACTDTGPAYEQTPVKEGIANDGAPAHGTLGQVMQGDPSSSVVYTPNQGFTGADTIKIIGFDDFGFGSDRGTITINVTTGADTTPPLLFQLVVTPAKFKFKKKTKVSFQLSEAATVTFRVAKRGAGRRVAGKCRKLTRKNRKRKHCDLTLAGTIKRTGHVGLNRFTYAGKLNGRRLGPGSYLLLGIARDAAGNTSSPVQKAKFTIKK